MKRTPSSPPVRRLTGGASGFRFIRYAVFSLLLGSAHSAHGQGLTIDFEEIPSSAGTIPSVSSMGFALANPVGFYVSSGPTYCQPECPGGSGHYLIAQGSLPSGPVTLRRENGEPFRLIGLDFGETNIGIPHPPGIRVDGQTSSGGSVSFALTLDGVNDGSGPLQDFQHATLPAGFGSLQAVTFTGVSGASLSQYNFSLDDLQVGPSPGPATVPMLSGAPRWILCLLLAGIGVLVLLGRHE